MAFDGVTGKIKNLYKEITSPLVFYVVDGMKSTAVKYVLLQSRAPWTAS